MTAKRQSLWKAYATVALDAEEALVDLLTAHFGAAVTSYSDFETRRATINVFLEDKAAWEPRKIRELANQWRSGNLPLSGTFPKFQVTRLRARDWAESWKHHFKAITVGKALQVRPPWIRKKAPRGCKTVVLEPGLSFGTGQHPTTGFCLSEIVRCRRRVSSLLDAGTGSGILAIAAAKLGYKQIEAFDFDPEAIRIARANAARNRVPLHIHFRIQDVAKLPAFRRRFDVICANLISNVLIQNRDRLLSRLADDGLLVLAGILAAEFSDVQRHFEAAGLKLVRSKSLREWRSGSFAWAG